MVLQADRVWDPWRKRTRHGFLDIREAILWLKDLNMDFPGGAVIKNPPANAGNTGSSPGPGRSHMPRSN